MVRGKSEQKVEKIPLWKLQPVMSRSGLFQTVDKEIRTDPFKQMTTKRLDELILQVLKKMQVEDKHANRKTLLLKQLGILLLSLKGCECCNLERLAVMCPCACCIRQCFSVQGRKARSSG